jgi:hypothetical protein
MRVKVLPGKSKQAGGFRVGGSVCLANQRKGRTRVINFSGKIFEVGGASARRECVAQLAFSAAVERKVCSIELAIKMRQKRTKEARWAASGKEIQAVIEIVEKVVFRIVIRKGEFLFL